MDIYDYLLIIITEEDNSYTSDDAPAIPQWQGQINPSNVSADYPPNIMQLI